MGYTGKRALAKPQYTPVEYQEHDRDAAIVTIAKFLRERAVASLNGHHPERECAFGMADYFKITARDLLAALCEGEL